MSGEGYTGCDGDYCNSSYIVTTLSTVNTTVFGLLPPDPPYSPWMTGFLATLAAITSLCTTVGNVLVVVAFVLERALRQPSNYLIASLAVTDILIGMISMPLYSVVTLMDYWPIGKTLCDLWLSLDYTVCLVSQYTVFLITMDRFCSVKAATKYRNWRTKRTMKIMIAVTWLVPAFIFFTSIMGWYTFTQTEPPKNLSCAAAFTDNPLFTVILVISYYWVTLVIMIGLYIGIYQVALSLHTKSRAKRQQLKRMNHLTTNNNNAEEDCNGSKKNSNRIDTKAGKLKTGTLDSQRTMDELSDFSTEPSSSDSYYSKKSPNTNKQNVCVRAQVTAGSISASIDIQQSPLWKPRNSLPTDSINWEAFKKDKKDEVSESEVTAEATTELTTELTRLTVDSNVPPSSKDELIIAMEEPHNTNGKTAKKQLFASFLKFGHHMRSANRCKQSASTNDSPKTKSKSENRARKALRTITFILGAFVICWTPYHVVVIIYSFCPQCVNGTFYQFSYWLCYMNSPLNPFAYALSNQQFKRTFIKILKGKYFKRRNTYSR